MEASGGPCVALAAPFGTVFVSGSSGYSYIPKGVISNSPRPEAQRDMKTCKELSRKWSVRKMRVCDVPGKDPVSQLFIHIVVCFSLFLVFMSLHRRLHFNILLVLIFFLKLRKETVLNMQSIFTAVMVKSTEVIPHHFFQFCSICDFIVQTFPMCLYLHIKAKGLFIFFLLIPSEFFCWTLFYWTGSLHFFFHFLNVLFLYHCIVPVSFLSLFFLFYHFICSLYLKPLFCLPHCIF